MLIICQGPAPTLLDERFSLHESMCTSKFKSAELMQPGSNEKQNAMQHIYSKEDVKNDPQTNGGDNGQIVT